MNNVDSLAKELLFSPNRTPFLLFILTLVCMTIIGSCILTVLLKKIPNKGILVGGGALLSSAYFVGLLSITSYVIKETEWLKDIFILHIVIALIFLFKQRRFTRHLLPDVNFQSSIITVLVIMYSLVLFLYAGNTVIGGDVLTQWSLATSFERGNYPMVLPWQSNSLTIYHQGTYIFLGLLQAITNIKINYIHYFFSVYIIAASLLFITGLTYEKVKNLFSLLPFIFGWLIFAPLFLVNNYKEFIQQLVVSNGIYKIVEYLSQVPSYENVKGAIGAGAFSLSGLIYINFIPHSIGIIIILIYLIVELPNNKIILKYAIVSFLWCSLLSINEASALVLAPIILWDLLSLYKHRGLKFIAKGIVCISLMTSTLFLLIQNPIRDSIFSPSKGEHRFKIIEPTDKSTFFNKPEYQVRFDFIKSSNISKFGTWYIPNMLGFVAFIALIAFITKSKYVTLLGVTATTSMLFGLIVINVFWSQNALRFINQSLQLSMIAIGFCVAEITFKNNWKASAFSLTIFIIFLPQILVNNAKFLSTAIEGNYPFYRGELLKKDDPLFNWIHSNTKYNAHFLMVDDYPMKDTSSQLTMNALSQEGLFIPTVLPQPKVLNADLSSQWFDAMRYLSPYALEKLKIDYVYIKKDADERYSAEIRSMLNSGVFFTKVFSNSEGNLFRVSQKYKQEKIIIKDINWINANIPDKATVYLGKIKYQEIRKGLLLSLQERTNLFGPPAIIGQDYFLFIEKRVRINSNLTQESINNIKYAILDSADTLPKNFDSTFYLQDNNEYINLWTKD